MVFGSGHTLVYENLIIDGEAWEVRLRGVPIDLTKTEFQVLAYLASRPRRVVTNEELTSAIWGDTWYGDDGNIAVHVSKLRHKLGESGLAPRYIRTVRGVGYRFEPQPDDRVGLPNGSPAFDALRVRPGAIEVHTDSDLRVMALWPRHAPVLGWDPEELLGRYFPVVDHPTWHDRASAAQALDALIASGVREWSARHRVRCADGTTALADFVTRIEVTGEGALHEIHFAFACVDDALAGGGAGDCAEGRTAVLLRA